MSFYAYLKERNSTELTALTGLLLIIIPIAFNVTFFLLQRAFEYPDILRKPTDYVLRHFKEGGAPLRRLWYAFAFSAVLNYLRDCASEGKRQTAPVSQAIVEPPVRLSIRAYQNSRGRYTCSAIHATGVIA
jgi:hypothetical protein